MVANKKNIRFVRVVALLVFLCFIPLLSYTFVFDPWQLFHKPWFREALFLGNPRFQDAGLINSYTFESVILGTSIAQNFSIEEASRVFSSSFINLSIEAGLLSERAIILNRVLQKKKISKVILSLDFMPEITVGKYKESLPPDQYSFLYNSNRIDDCRLYMDWQLFGCWNFKDTCRQVLPGKRVERLDELYIWQTDNPEESKKRGIEGWCGPSDTPEISNWMKETIHVAEMMKIGWFPRKENLDKKLEENLTGTFDTYVVPYVRQYPEVKFYLFFPPYSRLRFALLQQGYQSVFDLYCSYIEYVVQEMEEYENVKVFGFETEPFLDDLNHYIDILHYDPGINSQMLHWMAHKEHELTMMNIQEYLRDIRTLAGRYDVISLADQFRKCLNSEN